MDDISKFISEEGDPLFIKGKRVGFEEGYRIAKQNWGWRTKVIKNLTMTTDFSDERIATLLEVSPDFVREIRNRNQ